MLNVVIDYTHALDTLDRYDYQKLKIEQTTGHEAFHATYENRMKSSVALNFLATKRMILSKVPSGIFIRLSEALTFTLQLRNIFASAGIGMPSGTCVVRKRVLSEVFAEECFNLFEGNDVLSVV